MAKTYAHNRAVIMSQHCAEVLNGRNTDGRVAWTVRKKQSIIVVRSEIVVPRHYSNGNTASQQTTQNVHFYPAVYQQNTATAITVVYHTVGGYLCHKVPFLLLTCWPVDLLTFYFYFRRHCSSRAEMLR